MNWIALFSYILASVGGPGPNNIMAMTNAASHGIRRALLFCTGVLCGMCATMTFCALLTSVLNRYLPAAAPVLKWISAAYILFLAVNVFRHHPSKAPSAQRLRPDSVLNGILMQLINVKAFFYGITAFAGYILPSGPSFPFLIGCALMLAAAAFVSTCCWSLFGSLLQKLLKKHERVTNAIMALLLVFCAVMTVL